MRFQVPQFIEVEDKVVGPLTLKQFIYIAGGAGLSAAIYFLLNSLVLAFLPIVAVMACSLALAFYRINNKPLINVIEAAVRYWLGAKLYIWKKSAPQKPASTSDALKQERNYASVMVPKISDSKLKDLSWSLDIKER